MFKEINLCINDFFFVQNAYMDLMNINGIRSTKWSETLLFNQFEDINIYNRTWTLYNLTE